MKYILSALLVFFSFQAALFSRTKISNDNQLVTQLKVVENDSTFWYFYVYDTGRKVMETKSYRVDSTTWIRKNLTEWVYDGDNCIAQRERVWRNSQWDLTYSIDYVYLNNLLQTETHNTYTNGLSTPTRKIIFSYNQNLPARTLEYSNTVDGWHLKLETDLRYKNGTDADSVLISAYRADTLYSKTLSVFGYQNKLPVYQVIRQQKASGWLNTDSISWYYYPNSSLLMSQRSKKWNSSISKWENQQRIDYTYNDSSQLLSESYQHWVTQYWENDLRYNYVYNGAQVLLSKSQLLPIYEDWRKTISIKYSDIVAGNANSIQSTFEFWGGNTGDLTTSFIPFNFNGEQVIRRAKSIQLSFAEFNDTILQNKLPGLSVVAVYPNPSYGIFYISNSGAAIQSWVVTDLNGRVLSRNNAPVQSALVDITDLPKGIYLLKVITDDKGSVTKLIKR